MRFWQNKFYKKLGQFFLKIIDITNGNKLYQDYLLHFQTSHFQEKNLDQKPLNKRQFFAKREQEKWNKINRCC